MTTIQAGYKSLSLLAQLNLDRILYGATIVLALCGGAYVGSFFS